MQEEIALALDFLDEHPEAAVRTLEQHAAPRVAAFLLQIPQSYSVLVLRLALPAFAGRLCRELDTALVASLLLEQEVGRMVAVLRHLGPDSVQAVLRECPQSRRRACELLLRHPLDQVGAWIVPNTAVVTRDFSVGEVLGFLKDSTEDTFSKYVFIVDREGLPLGRVSYLSLLQANPALRVSELMETGVTAVSGRLPLPQALQLAVWEESDLVPVTGVRQEFIGVLRHADLRRGLRQLERPGEPAPQVHEALSGLAEIYGKSLLALFDTLGHVLQSGPGAKEEPR